MMTPGKIRLATGSFVALCVAIVVNTLFLQNDRQRFRLKSRRSCGKPLPALQLEILTVP